MATTPATEYTNLANARVRVKDIERLKEHEEAGGGSGKFTPAGMNKLYPAVSVATFTTMHTDMNT